MQNCIGAIDGTHIPCVLCEDNPEAWINRKGVNSQNILTAYSFDMKFTYMLAGYEGYCHDARMLEEAITFHGFPIPPPGKFYVTDSGYASKDFFLSPFRREIYHLSEYWKGHANRAPGVKYLTTRTYLCKIALSELLVYRRPDLKYLGRIWYGVGDHILEKYTADGVPVGGHVDVNADVVLADRVDDAGPSMGRQQDASRRGAMNQLIEVLTNVCETDINDFHGINPLEINVIFTI
ncbi:hypothetical protein TIFTF001_021048 [Ficus carica]|uniref:DDE Tnp4 domain-containing protein n=1 Tax=Ficus carica TaxID=3494 RepID=A0AA88DD98_FICCA|nr:hypothetical protein TIFTF001_021048 [Ficus carica]